MLRWSFVVSAGLLSLALALPAQAAQRTFVSTSGNDANTASNCSNTAPCRGFTAALTVTDSGGEIIVLSSGGYGAVTINKSVSIIAPEGVYAGISAFSTNAITVATAGIDVVLKGLTINSMGTGGFAVEMSAGNSLIVQNCTIKHFSTGGGLYVHTAADVQLLDSLMEDNFTGASFENGANALVSRSRFIAGGLAALAVGSGIKTKVEVNRSEASKSEVGYYAFSQAGGQVELYIKDSVASRNLNGVWVQSSSTPAIATVSGSLISGNATSGLNARGFAAKLVASGNIITHNGIGLRQEETSVLQSTGDNTVSDNTTATGGTITPLAKL